MTCLVLSGCAYAQEPIYTPMKGNYKFKGLKADTLLLIPSFNDTTAANTTYLDQVAGAMIRCGNDFWMRNASTTAWLQNVNVGNGSSPAVNFVKKVYRKANRDSIFYIINPTDTQYAFTDRGFDTLRRSNDSVYAYRFGTKVFQYKDSGASRLNDSPDRINGTATAKVTSDYNNAFSQEFVNSVGFIVDNSATAQFNDVDDFKVTVNDTMRFNASSGSQKIIFNVKNRIVSGEVGTPSKTGNLLYAYAKTSINLSTGNDTAYIPGTYIITSASTNTFILPQASEYPGQVIYIINNDATDANIDAISSNIKDATSAGISLVSGNAFAIITSDGSNWWYTENKP